LTGLIEVHQKFTYGRATGREREFEQLLCDSLKKMTLNGTNKEIIDSHYETLRNLIGEVVCVQPSESISVFIACRSLKSVKYLMELYEEGGLQKLLHAIFTGLAAELHLPLKPAGLFIDQTHLQEALAYFQGCVNCNIIGGIIKREIELLLNFCLTTI